MSDKNNIAGITNYRNKKHKITDNLKLGFIGLQKDNELLEKFISNRNPYCEFLKYDIDNNYNTDVVHANAIFIHIPISLSDDLTQDLTFLKSILNWLPDVPIFITTPLLPGTCDSLSKEFNKKIYFLPEFIFSEVVENNSTVQTMIFTAEADLLSKIFHAKNYILMPNLEAETTVYAKNIYLAVQTKQLKKLQELSDKNGVDFSKILGFLKTSNLCDEIIGNDFETFSGLSEKELAEKLSANIQFDNEIVDEMPKLFKKIT